ncbi:MAG: hypothetical protein J6Q42_02365, partial [Clostridia bacterium]|nr:hypothetical protein [Clostridia bacterium]
MIESMKAVCVVTRAAQKDALLTALRDLGVLHIAEKKTANSVLLERFSTISRLLQDLKEYASEETEPPALLSDEQFEELYQQSVTALEQKAKLTALRTELLLESEKLRPWGDFDSEVIKALPKNLDLHFYRLDKKTYKQLAQDETVRFIRLSSVEQMETVAVIGKLDSSVNALEFVVPEKGPAQLQKEIAVCEREISACETTLKEAA